MKTYIQPPLKRDLDRVIIYLDTNELRSGQEPVIIAKNIIDIVKTSTTNKSSIFLWRGNLNGKGRQVNNSLQKLYVENNLPYANHDKSSHGDIAVMRVFY